MPYVCGKGIYKKILILTDTRGQDTSYRSGVIHRDLKTHALSVRLTHFGLKSRTPATHRISHVFLTYSSTVRAARQHEPRCPHGGGIKRSPGVLL